MLSGSSVETRCSFCQYCVLRSPFHPVPNQLTSQLVPVDIQSSEARQLANRFRELCRNELFSREILRTGSTLDELANT